ncbi:MAG TPA: aspartate kinase [Xanthomonadales bacterium]|nr:aspartate kinase [Xanthomonadales bacterium]
MNPDWVVLKFGGTSVAGGPQWQTIRNLLQQRLDANQRVLLVCSAVSGVTNQLTELADSPSTALLEKIVQRHVQLATELEVGNDSWLEPGRQRMEACVLRLQQGENHAARADLLACGEWLSTRIGSVYLSRFMPVDWLDVRHHLVARPEPELSAARQWLSASCVAGPDAAFQKQCAAMAPVVVTQGYTAANPDGATVLLGRGGSDTSAALLAGRLQASWVEIWTDVPGLFSADPRLVADARLLEDLEFAEALEMAAAGAKVVHPSCIRAAAETGTPIHIRDTHRPGLTGTRISHLAGTQSGVKTITCQKDMLVLLLAKIDTRREVGFLASVFGVFRQRGVSIDLVATSETTTTVALNRPANLLDDASLAALVQDLAEYCTVEVFANCVCVNLVGNSVRKALAQLQGSMQYFADNPLLMMSQSANDLCLSLLLPEGEHAAFVQQLHRELIIANQAAPAFGPSWHDVQRWE